MRLIFIDVSSSLCHSITAEDGCCNELIIDHYISNTSRNKKRTSAKTSTFRREGKIFQICGYIIIFHEAKGGINKNSPRPLWIWGG
jgi:hypothetical protein